MRISNDWPDRVYVEDSQFDRMHELYSKASEGGKEAPFKSLKEVLMAAAMLGYNTGRKEKLEKNKEIIFTRYLDSQTDLPLVACMAIADTESVDVINNKKTVINIFQEYIKGGFEILYESVNEGVDKIKSYSYYLLKNYIEG